MCNSLEALILGHKILPFVYYYYTFITDILKKKEI